MAPRAARGKLGGDHEIAARRLHDLGLSEYQARAYVALITLGTASASEVSAMSGVPQPRIYGTLKSLEEAGVAASSLGPPTRYRALPVESFLQRLATDLRDQAVNIEAQSVQLGKLLQPRASASERVGELAVLRGRRSIVARAAELARGAKKTLEISGPGLLAGEDLVRGLTGAIRERAAAGVRVRILYPIAESSLARARKIARHAEVRHNAFAARTFAVLVDREEALIGFVSSEEEVVRPTVESALVTAEPSIVAFATAAMEHLWTRGTDLGHFSAEFSGPGDRAYLYDDGMDVIEAYRRTVAQTKATLDIIASEMGVYQLLSMRAALAERRAAGVKIRILCPKTRANSKVREELGVIAEIRVLNAPGIRSLVADGRRALVIEAGAKADSPFLEADAFGASSLLATQKALVDVLSAHFAAEWERAAPTRS